MLSRLRNATLFGTLVALAPFTQAGAQNQRHVSHRLGPIEVLGDAPSYAEVGLGAFDVFAEPEPRAPRKHSGTAANEISPAEGSSISSRMPI